MKTEFTYASLIGLFHKYPCNSQQLPSIYWHIKNLQQRAAEGKKGKQGTRTKEHGTAGQGKIRQASKQASKQTNL
eukprot:4690586-Amphidinium_carterae.2